MSAYNDVVNIAVSLCDNEIGTINIHLNNCLEVLNSTLSKIMESNIKEYKKKPLIAALEKRITRLNKVIKTL